MAAGAGRQPLRNPRRNRGAAAMRGADRAGDLPGDISFNKPDFAPDCIARNTSSSASGVVSTIPRTPGSRAFKPMIASTPPMPGERKSIRITEATPRLKAASTSAPEPNCAVTAMSG